MTYDVKRAMDNMKKFECPKCKSNIALITKGKLFCRNCGEEVGAISEGKSNKYGAKRTEFNGKIYDSKFEALVANDLETRKKAGDIKDYDIQYKVIMWVYREDGVKAYEVKHKVDFRIHHNDGSFELYEAKGIETDDYKWRRKNLENVWLPLHPDHTYTVIKQQQRRKR
jgi:uncharacterized Zn finger protein (UPF0148 family)